MFSKTYNKLFHESGSWKKTTIFPSIAVTPELATELLRMNDNNRPIRHGVVKQYASEMKSGKWRFNGDNIRISSTQKLLDGQHRLMAIIESGTTQVFNIQSGLADEVFDVMDIGRQRTASDAISVKGYKNAGIMSSAVKLIMAHNNGSLRRQAQGSASSDKFTNQDVVNYLEKQVDIELMQEMCSMANKWAYKAKFYSPGTYAAFGYMFAEKDREQCVHFFELLSTGENIGKQNHSMIFLLRQKLISFQQSNSMLQTVDKYALLIKAWNAYRKGKEVGILSWQPKEDFPKIN